jgi:hypothetical protein
MSDKYTRTIIPCCSAGGVVHTSQADMANTTASSFPTACSSHNYDLEFRAIKNNAESFLLNFTLRVAEAYDTLFTTDELLAALDRCCSTTAGPDDIHNEMLSQPSTRRQEISAILVQPPADGEPAAGRLERNYRHPCSEA